MQHQQPYTVSFLRWKCDYGPVVNSKQEVSEPYKKVAIQGVLVAMESTRSKKTAFKTRTNWDEPASTYLLLDEDKDMFWDCMDYALVGAICTENVFEEAEWNDTCSYEWFESLPKPNSLHDGTKHMHYFRLLQEKFPEAQFKLVNNGFGTHYYYD